MSSRHDRGHVLIAAQSGRALASAARRAGYQPLVADQFADLDTRQIAEATQRVRGALDGAKVMRALGTLAAGRSPVGLVYGSGFEDHPALLQALSQRHVLLGNSGATVARVTDPIGFAALCAGLGVPHPETRREPRREAAGRDTWLVKRQGGTGGGHISTVEPQTRHSAEHYVQLQVAGTPVSALFLAAGGRAVVLGFSAQWADPAPGQPYRYGGAIRPAALPLAIAQDIGVGVGRLAAALGLVGLNSADCLVREDGFDLLEINPRPGAALDVFRDTEGVLFQLHVEACLGRLPDALPDFGGAAGAAVVFAPRSLSLPPGFAWPDWTADHQPSLTPVPADAPFCTVLAEAPDAAAVRALLDRRRADILARAGAAP